MQLIDADTAQPGLTIVAAHQTQGKGQRGRQWKSVAGENLLMSIVCCPNRRIDEQFVFSAASAVAIAEVLNELHEGWNVRIKWPNDIIVNDKKAGGILIENVLRGNTWSFGIIGLGLNILQTSFSNDLPFATSLKMASGKDFSVQQIFEVLRRNILLKTNSSLSTAAIMREYNDCLFRRDCLQKFSDGTQEWEAFILGVVGNGALQVQLGNGEVFHYHHGSVQWVWE